MLLTSHLLDRFLASDQFLYLWPKLYLALRSHEALALRKALRLELEMPTAVMKERWHFLCSTSARPGTASEDVEGPTLTSVPTRRVTNSFDMSSSFPKIADMSRRAVRDEQSSRPTAGSRCDKEKGFKYPYFLFERAGAVLFGSTYPGFKVRARICV
jgi:hypothetical protein